MQFFSIYLILLPFFIHISQNILDFDFIQIVSLNFSLNFCAEVVIIHRMHEILLFDYEPPLLVESSLKLFLQYSEILNNSHHILL